MIDLYRLVQHVAPGSVARVRRYRTLWTNPEDRGVKPELVSETDMWDGCETDPEAMEAALAWCVTWTDGATPPDPADLIAAIPDMEAALAAEVDVGAAAARRKERMARLNAARALAALIASGQIDPTALDPEDRDALAAVADEAVSR